MDVGWGGNKAAFAHPFIYSRNRLELVGIKRVDFLFFEIGLQLFRYWLFLITVNVQHIFKQAHDLFLEHIDGAGEAEVKEKLAQAMESIKDLDVSRTDDYTVDSWLTSWYNLYAKPNVRVSTAEYYRRSIELHVNPRISDINLNKLTGRNLQKIILTFRLRNDKLNYNKIKEKGGLS